MPIAHRPGLLFALALLALPGEPARAQVSQNVTLLSTLDQYAGYNDIWGYTHTNGVEYALLGIQTGVSVVNISDRQNPYETGFITTATSIWQDIKTYETYAYVVNETAGGLTIIDLSDPETPLPAVPYTGFQTAHNLYIDTDAARLYTAGANNNRGTSILSLADPLAPVLLGTWNTQYIHDVMARDDVLYASCINVATLYILDVTNPAGVTTLGTITNYPNDFTHNAWPTEDGNYVMTTDETTGAACRMWDITNPATAYQTDLYLPNAATIPHNAHIDGNLAFISHYTLGVRVVDVSDPFDLQEVGFYDTYSNSNGGGFGGCWGAFPYFPLSPNLLIASDRTYGLFILEYNPPLPTDAPAVERAAGDLALETGSPNPFRAGQTTRLSFTIPSATSVSAGVHDVSGRRVALLEESVREAGTHELSWNGRVEGGAAAAPGVYFVRLETDAGSVSGKVVVIR